MTTVLQNLKESNEFLNLLLENINSAVLIADENLQIHQFNNTFLNLFDKAADFNLDQQIAQILKIFVLVSDIGQRIGSRRGAKTQR